MNTALKKKIEDILEIVKICPDNLQIPAFEILLQNSVQLETMSIFSLAIKKYEAQLDCLSDEAQKANLELQIAFEKQQKAIQTLSNIMKTLADTARNIIDNIR